MNISIGLVYAYRLKKVASTPTSATDETWGFFSVADGDVSYDYTRMPLN